MMVASTSATFSAWVFSSLILWATSRLPCTVRSALPSTMLELWAISWAEPSTSSMVRRVSSMAAACSAPADSWPRAAPTSSWESTDSRRLASCSGLEMPTLSTQATISPIKKMPALTNRAARMLFFWVVMMDCREKPATTVPITWESLLIRGMLTCRALLRLATFCSVTGSTSSCWAVTPLLRCEKKDDPSCRSTRM
jgi:hypothetical protein